MLVTIVKLYWRLRREYRDAYPGRLVLIPAQLGCPVTLMIAVSRRYRGASITCRDGGRRA